MEDGRKVVEEAHAPLTGAVVHPPTPQADTRPRTRTVVDVDEDEDDADEDTTTEEDEEDGDGVPRRHSVDVAGTSASRGRGGGHRFNPPISIVLSPSSTRGACSRSHCRSPPPASFFDRFRSFYLFIYYSIYFINKLNKLAH
jgi:hypothetical protein